eukprot:4948416-Amphidinium_carterae.1
MKGAGKSSIVQAVQTLHGITNLQTAVGSNKKLKALRPSSCCDHFKESLITGKRLAGVRRWKLTQERSSTL